MLERLRSLRSKHAVLEANIGNEHARLMPDTLRLQTLKKLRLKCREEIAYIENVLGRKGIQANA